jgi:hypothetical protein
LEYSVRERLLIRFCRTDAYIYSTVGISTKISHQPIQFISRRHFSSSPWWIDLLSSTLPYSISMMTWYKPRQASHLHLSIRRFAEAHDWYCCGYYTVGVYIHPSQYIMHQTDVCYDVACMCFDQYLLLIRRRLNVLVAGEPINLTRLLEMRSQTTSWPLPSNMKKVLLGMATFLRKNIHRTNKMLYNNQLWYSRR